MKKTLCFTLTLFTFVTLTFMTNSFAQDDSPEYVVRVIYFFPKDRIPDPDMNTKLATLIKDVQDFFADQMEDHGFGRKTFMLETDESGKILVHHVKGEFDEAYYRENFGNALIEINKKFDSSKNINIVIVDTDINFGGFATNRNAVVSAATNDFIYLIAHEVGHVFGLGHDWRNESYIMTQSEHPSVLSRCAAEWLDAHKYFNPTSRTFNDNTRVQMRTPDLVKSPAAIRVQFEISDPDGLHQAQLFLPSEMGHGLFDCRSLDGNSVVIEFVTTELLAIKSGTISLNVIDAQGNPKSFPFQIDITPILPDSEPISIPDINLATVVRDTLGLASNSQITQLDMLKLMKLEVRENRNISDLTGLEHATHLQILTINYNQIQDLTPLTKLTKLKRVQLGGNQISNIPSLLGMKQLTALSLGFNQISDITPIRELTQLTDLYIGNGNPINTEHLFSVLTQLKRLRILGLPSTKINDITFLAKLTQLRILYLSYNQISDITPLVALTNLEYIYLSNNQIIDIMPINGLTQLRGLFLANNQISDVKPFAELINLRELGLIGNPIKDREPLLDLLQKNPDVKIYLKNYDEPLPVTLSHFRAEHTDAGVVLNWITQSEVDNAGFYIYRSETKEGEFKVINPDLIQGAGTTGERNNYTWTDTTAKPNTIYYYRIEDVSHAGDREQLATVRLRGLVSARGKLTTRWADLKTQE